MEGRPPYHPPLGRHPFPGLWKKNIVRRVSRRRLTRAVAFVRVPASIRRNSACKAAPGNAALLLAELRRQIQPGLEPKEDGNFSGQEASVGAAIVVPQPPPSVAAAPREDFPQRFLTTSLPSAQVTHTRRTARPDCRGGRAPWRPPSAPGPRTSIRPADDDFRARRSNGHGWHRPGGRGHRRRRRCPIPSCPAPTHLYRIPGQDVVGSGVVSATPDNHPTRRLPHEVRHHRHRRPPGPHVPRAA